MERDEDFSGRVDPERPEEMGRKIRAARDSVGALRKRATDLPHSESFELVAASLDEIQSMLEELQSAQDALLDRNAQLAAARRAAEAERQRYRDLFEHAPDGYVVTDVGGRIREVNRAAARLLNATPESLRGQDLAHFMEDDRAAFGTTTGGLSDAEAHAEWRVRLHPIDAPVFLAGLTISVVRDADGMPSGLRWQVRDLSRAKRPPEAGDQPTSTT